MTHDELLAIISVSESFLKEKEQFLPAKHISALRAVVELHKPVQGRSDITTYDYIGCDSCVEWSHDGNMNLKYPCPTIQAITDSLK